MTTSLNYYTITKKFANAIFCCEYHENKFANKIVNFPLYTTSILQILYRECEVKCNHGWCKETPKPLLTCSRRCIDVEEQNCEIILNLYKFYNSILFFIFAFSALQCILFSFACNQMFIIRALMLIAFESKVK